MRDFLFVMADEFAKQRIKSQIWVHDHNICHIKKHVRPLLKDARLRKAIDAVAWHDYEGNPAEMGALAREFPELPMYHTERSHYSLEGMASILYLLNQGCRGHNHWTTIQDEYGAPHQYFGGSEKTTSPVAEGHLPALVAPRKKPNAWRATLGHEFFKHLTVHVHRGAAVLPAVSKDTGPNCAAFRNVDGRIVLVAVNREKKAKKFRVVLGEAEARLTLPARSVGTYCFY